MVSRDFQLWDEPALATEALETPNQKRKREAEVDALPVAKRTRQAIRRALKPPQEPTFHLFARFPAEIKMMVWELVPAVRRVVNIWGGHVIVDDGQSVAPNPITQVCKDARKVTKQRMISLRPPVARFSFDNQNFVPFDFDTVWDVGRLTGAARLMHEHLFPVEASPFNIVLPDALPNIAELKIRSLVPWENLQTVAIGTGLKWKELRKFSDEKKEKMRGMIRELFPNAKRIFITSHIDIMDNRPWNINPKVIYADEIPSLEKKKKIEFETPAVEKQISLVRKLGDGQFFLESRYIPDEDDLDLTGLGGVFGW